MRKYVQREKFYIHITSGKSCAPNDLMSTFKIELHSKITSHWVENIVLSV